MTYRDAAAISPKWERFHEKHEALTEAIYQTGDMLPHRYVFVLTNLCNLKCSFCFQARDKRQDRMELEDWLALARQLPDYARVTLTGGEPFVFKGFEEIFDFVARRFDCNLITNGTLLNEARVDFLLQRPKFRVLSVSIDNIGNTLRNLTPRQWQAVMEGMRYFARRRDALEAPAQLDAKTVVLDENAHELCEIHRFCLEELHCDTHSFQFLKGSPLQHADVMFPFEKIHEKSCAPVYKNFKTITEQLEMVREYNIREGRTGFMHPKAASLTGTTPIRNIELLNRREHDPLAFHPCKYPWSSVHINVDGHLFPCLAVSMGNVKQQSLRKIIDGPAYREFCDIIRQRGSVEACNRCGWLKPNFSRPARAEFVEQEGALAHGTV